MYKQTYTKFLLGLLLMTPLWGVGRAAAQGKAPARGQAGQTTITDAAGRVHKRSARVTDAQRKTVAKRQVQALRLKAAQKKSGVTK